MNQLSAHDNFVSTSQISSRISSSNRSMSNSLIHNNSFDSQCLELARNCVEQANQGKFRNIWLENPMDIE